MNEREKILARIREALTVQAPFPGEPRAPGQQRPSPAQVRKWLPPAADSFDEQLALFRQNATSLKADFYALNLRDELKSRLLALRDAEDWRKIASHSGELTDLGVSALGVPVLKTDSGYDINELEKCDAGITECDALIAQTGSVLVANRSAGGRALSVLPPHHVVLARRKQLLPDLPAAFELLKQKYGCNYPGMISFITGPSRTGDIERILVLGAHGPRKLTIFFL
ncbi:MAG: LUD domain-containing protein [Verrucomicrobiota bacterium]|nr:LUD domain-containing protein [Verrucomicrobiota bacterium]